MIAPNPPTVMLFRGVYLYCTMRRQNNFEIKVISPPLAVGFLFKRGFHPANCPSTKQL